MNAAYFGRQWKLTVTPQATGEQWTVSASGWKNEALRITFSVEQTSMPSYWFADICITNFSPDFQQVIQKGDTVTLEAGYENPGAGLLFSGRVFQPIWERSSETDYKLWLHCFLGLYEDEHGLVSLQLGSNNAQITQAQAVHAVAKAAGIPCLDKNLDPILSTVTMPRGKPFFGRARQFFNQIALSNHLPGCWIAPDGVHISAMDAPIGEAPGLIFAPPYSSTAKSGVGSTTGLTKYTLIGSPSQTFEGANFRLLLDTDISIGQLVQINAILNKVPMMPWQQPILIDKDGLFIVGGLRHTGDSRGQEWYTDVVAVTRPWSKLRGVIAR